MELYSVPADLVSEIMHVVCSSLAESWLATDPSDPTLALAPDPSSVADLSDPARRTLALPEAAPPRVVQQDPRAA